MGKIDAINENAISAFNRIRQKHGFNAQNESTIKVDEDKLREILETTTNHFEPYKVNAIEKAVRNDRIFDILRFIDEQSFSNNLKAALGIILSGEISEIPKAIEYLQKEIEK